MSHLKEREDKICLNCGAAIHGRFCHVCGQENIEPKENFWHLVTHFLFDLIHFDGKFFSTIKYLLFKPGYLSTLHLSGKRADYLHPIRMYIFTSAFFFLIFFSLVGHLDSENPSTHIKKETYQDKLEYLEYAKKGQEFVLKMSTSDTAKSIIKKAIQTIDDDIATLKKDTTAFDKLKYDKIDTSILHRTITTKNKSGRLANIINKIEKNPEQTKVEFLKSLEHSFPRLLFISLPFFALLLQLLYIRYKKYNYVNHLIFTIHNFCFTFIYLIVLILLQKGFEKMGIIINGWFTFLFVLVFAFYFYKALRNFYEQSRFKTIAKYLLVLVGAFFLYFILFIIDFIIIGSLL